MPPPPTTLHLREYETLHLTESTLTTAEAQHLQAHYSPMIAVTAPSALNRRQWALTAQGWVGQLPISPSLTLHIAPKVPLANLLGMLAYAWRLPLRWLATPLTQATEAGFADRLAQRLADGVLRRCRQGLQRRYETTTAPRSALRGRLELDRQLANPQRQLWCTYHYQTSDIADNQILAWTLWRLARSGLGDAGTRQNIRRAYRQVRRGAALRPFTAANCQGRTYDRLNADYAPLHALCAFFLAHLDQAPTPNSGDTPSGAFLVNMNQLFEQFVAEWLSAHLPAGWRVQAQERITLAGPQAPRLALDLVLYDATGAARFVLDTKYKSGERLHNADLYQIVTYAKARRCSDAVLVYPSATPPNLDVWLEDLHIRSLPFSLAGDLETAGQGLVAALLEPQPSL